MAEPHPESVSSAFKSAHLYRDPSEAPVDPSQSHVFLPSPPTRQGPGSPLSCSAHALWGGEGGQLTKDTDKRQAEEHQKAQSNPERKGCFQEEGGGSLGPMEAGAKTFREGARPARQWAKGGVRAPGERPI